MSTIAARTSDAAPVANNSLPTTTPWRRELRKLLTTLRFVEPYGQSALLLSLRLLYGWFFVETGWGKLMNLERTTGFFQSLGLPTPGFMAALVATTELAGGILLAVGAGTRFASAALSVVLLTALATAHADDAFKSLSAFTEQAPYPFLVATLVLLAFGAGRLSLDGWLRARLAKRQPDTTSSAGD